MCGIPPVLARQFFGGRSRRSSEPEQPDIQSQSALASNQWGWKMLRVPMSSMKSQICSSCAMRTRFASCAIAPQTARGTAVDQ